MKLITKKYTFHLEIIDIVILTYQDGISRSDILISFCFISALYHKNSLQIPKG